jgi:hypothetical protein
MGEATYNFRAEFSNQKQAKAAAKRLKSFMRECNKAYYFWQDNRESQKLSSEQFWMSFEKRFPVVFEFLKFNDLLGINYTTDCNNSLAGELSYTQDEKSPDNVSVIGLDSGIYVVKYHEYVWHGATWAGLQRWTEKKLGATHSEIEMEN